MARIGAPRRGQTYSTLNIRDFSGGLNLRDAPSEVAPNESPNCLNVTLDERGGVVKRLGLTQVDSTPLTNSAKNIFYWSSKNTNIVQDGAVVKKTDAFASYTNIRTFTTTERVAFAEMKELLIMVHPTDGVYTYDGTTVSAAAGSPKGTCVAVWQNKAWVGGDPTSGSKARIWFSAAGNPASWAGTDFVDLREVDDTPVTALGQGQQFDVVAKPTLMVFKGSSTYRIYDSSTGAFQTLHTQAGAAGPLAVATAYGRVATMNGRGIWLTDGVSPPVLASEKIQPIFDPLQINFSQHQNWCAGNFGNRILFSFTWGSGQTTNNRTLEFHPLQGWFTVHDFGVSCMTGVETTARHLYGASATDGHVFEVFSGGSDNGAAIAAQWQTRWFEPAAGYKVRLRRLMVEGRGLFNLYVVADYSNDQGQLQNVNIPAIIGNVWNTAVWDFDIWGTTRLEGFEVFHSLGVVRAVSLNMTETSTKTTTGHSPSGGSAATSGAFACYGLDLQYVNLFAS